MKKKRNTVSGFLFVLAVAFGLTGCGDTTGPGEGEPDDPIAGNWIGIFDESFVGPGDKDADVLYFEFTDDGEFMLLSFFGSDPAGGHRGTYTFDEDEGVLQLNMTHEWSDTEFDWVQDNYIQNLAAAISADGSILTVGVPGGDGMELQNVTLAIPQHLAGEWQTSGATMQIDETGTFQWTEAGAQQSGTLQDFDYPDGDSYLLVNITYCEYSAGDYCDYYTVNRYELNASGDQLTLWHGDDVIALELLPGMDGK